MDQGLSSRRMRRSGLLEANSKRLPSRCRPQSWCNIREKAASNPSGEQLLLSEVATQIDHRREDAVVSNRPADLIGHQQSSSPVSSQASTDHPVLDHVRERSGTMPTMWQNNEPLHGSGLKYFILSVAPPLLDVATLHRNRPPNGRSLEGHVLFQYCQVNKPGSPEAGNRNQGGRQQHSRLRSVVLDHYGKINHLACCARRTSPKAVSFGRSIGQSRPIRARTEWSYAEYGAQSDSECDTRRCGD